ncbi:MAG TPA: response regulator transcription factor [Thiotrichales bacterium]|nr:response regulator transcription factor [Thiotrichales bacterium]
MPNTHTKGQLLVIEDDADIAGLLAIHLSDIAFNVDIASNGIDGLNRALNTPYNMIVLDLMLPGMDGLDICRRLRQQKNNTPILMLTAKSSELDRVLGLELGADDYLTKPFSVKELQARVKAILRRVELAGQDEPGDDALIAINNLQIDTVKRQVLVDNKAVSLTAREYDLLLHFARHPGRVYSRTQLLDQVWGYGHDGYEHTVNSHINRLRKKIERNPERAEYIQTVWGVGYKFAEAIAS